MHLLSEYLRASIKRHVSLTSSHTLLKVKRVSSGVIAQSASYLTTTNPQPYLSFVSCPRHVLIAIFFPIPGSQSAFSCYVSLVSFDLNSSLAFLCFSTLIFLKRAGELFCRMTLNLDAFDVSSSGLSHNLVTRIALS